MECGLETMTVSGCRSAMNFAALSNASMVDWIRFSSPWPTSGRMRGGWGTCTAPRIAMVKTPFCHTVTQ